MFGERNISSVIHFAGLKNVNGTIVLLDVLKAFEDASGNQITQWIYVRKLSKKVI